MSQLIVTAGSRMTNKIGRLHFQHFLSLNKDVLKNLFCRADIQDFQ